MSKITVTKINAEFLSGNLFDSTRGFDVEASAGLFVELCREALQAVYPAAEITFCHQEGRDPRAHELLTTTVVFSDGSMQTATDRGDVEIVNAICEGVYNEQDWLVED